MASSEEDHIPNRPIVYVSSGIFGYLYRWFPIARALHELAMTTVFVTSSERAADHARAEGLSVVFLPGDGEPRREGQLDDGSNPWPSPLGLVFRRVPGLSLGPRRRATALAEAKSSALRDVSSLVGAVSQLNPLMVITEAEEHRTIRALTNAGQRLMLFEDLYSTRPGRDVPFPAASSLVPTGRRSSVALAWLSWTKFFAVTAMKRRAESWWVRNNDWHSTLAALPSLPIGSISTRYLQYYDYPDLPRIKTTARELSFAGEPLRGQRVGPIVDEQRIVHDVDPEFASDWAEITVQRGGGRPVVFVSLGTFLVGMNGFVRAITDCARTLAQYTFVISAGLDRNLWDDVALSNVHVFTRVPQMQVLASCDLVVSTGGLNTGHESLWFGVPMINIPIAGIDTKGNAARLTFHGVARHIIARDFTAERLRSEIAKVMTDPGYRARAKEVSAQLRTYDSIESSARLLREFAQRA
jgi:UDP:flavonoid glycosyltransferase YjiC (YdhE family)